jgi:hypothetical protein
MLKSLSKILRQPTRLVGRLTGTLRRKTKRLDKEIMLPPIAGSSARQGYLSAVLIAKNEASYLIEWLEFHRLAGVEHVYIYDNGSSDESVAVLQSYIHSGFVTCVPWANFDQNAVPQRQAYAHALCNFGARWRWMAFIDADEFLFPVAEGTLREVLRRYEDVAALAVPWHMFGFSGHHTPSPGLVIENYTFRAPFPSVNFPKLSRWKSIVDPARVRHIVSAHTFEVDGLACDENRRPLKPKFHPSLWSSNILRINHYFTRSREEFAAKASFRGASSDTTRQRMADMIEAHTVEDTTIQHFLPQLRAALAAN